MNAIIPTPLRCLLLIVCCLFGLIFQAAALEISDITFPLTRTEADQTFSKDYSYVMLADGSVRRTWDLGDKTVIIDFSTVDDKAVLIAITYKKPVSVKKGIADAHTIARGRFSEDATWDTPKDKAAKQLLADTYGLNNARRKKLSDKAVLFYELNDKGNRIERVSLFGLMPSTNRWRLEEVRPGMVKTAMGTNWGDKHIDAVYADEQRRQSASRIPATQPSENEQAATPTRVRTAMGTRYGSPTDPKQRPTAGTAPSQASQRPTAPSTQQQTRPKKTTKPVAVAMPNIPGAKVVSKDDNSYTLQVGEAKAGHSEKTSLLPPAPDWLKAVGIEQPEWTHYIVLGIFALILLVFIIRSLTSTASKIKQQQQFNQLINNSPANKNNAARRN